MPETTVWDLLFYYEAKRKERKNWCDVERFILDFFNSKEALKHIFKEKIDFLNQFAAQNKSGNAKEMAAMVLSTIQLAKKKGLTFAEEETALLIQVLKQNMTKEEARKADQLLHLMNDMKKKTSQHKRN